MHKIVQLNSVLGNYTVQFLQDLSTIESLIDKNDVVTFIDSNVQRLYPSLVKESNIVVECIESNKTFAMAEVLLTKMVERNIKSNSTVLVIGGGILQDLVGFCCSVYHRGINYILVPTTLLAQADSCIGGKTSINFNKKKNILGTFFPPKQILIYSGFLDTLEESEYTSGMGEVYKFHILQNKMNEFGFALDKSNIDNTIYHSLLYKKHILDIDEFDKKERKFLNFGHTFGHAIEFTSNNAVPHGIAVIIGSVVSCNIADRMGYSVSNIDLIYAYAKEMLKDVKLNVEWFSLSSILEAVKLDKKNTGNIIDVLMDTYPILTSLDNLSIVDEALQFTFTLLTNNETF
jgi:3-dehydroquinate synthase